MNEERTSGATYENAKEMLRQLKEIIEGEDD